MSEEQHTNARVQELLSELRSLAHMRRWGGEEREAVWQLLCESSALDVTQHDTIIIPYLTGLTQHLHNPLRDAEDAQAMRQMIDIAPCATFRLLTAEPGQLALLRRPQLASRLGAIHFEPHGQSLQSLDILLDEADTFDHLEGLDLTYNTLSMEQITRITRSPRFAHLTTLSLHHCRLDQARIEALCEQGANNRLIELHIGENQPGLEGFKAIFERLCTPALERLDLSASAISSMGNNGGDTFLKDEGLEALATSSNLHNLRALHMSSSRLSALGLARLAASSQVTRLEELVLHTNPDVGAEGAALIATSENFSRLEHLSLATCQLGSKGVAHLARSSTLTRLRVLNLGSNKVEDEALERLASAPILQHLKALHLGANRIQDEGAAMLLSSRHVAALHTLSLHGNHLGERACRALCDNEELRLESLNVSRCKLGDARGAVLLGSPALTTLKELSIKGNGLGPLSALALARSTYLGALETLELNDNALDEQTCEVLFSSPSLRRLKHLHLKGNQPGMQGLLALARAGFFEGLETLVLANTGLDHAQLRLLFFERTLPALRRLDLGHNNSLKDIGCLFHVPFLGQLRSLDISQCDLDEEQVDRLIALPGLRDKLRQDLHQQRRRMFEYY